VSRLLVSLGLLLAACGESHGDIAHNGTGAASGRGSGGGDAGAGGSSGDAGRPGGIGGSSTGGANATGGANGSKGGASANAGASGSSAGAGDDCEEEQQPVNGPSFEGDLALATPADVEAARDYSSISGSLYVSTLTELDLPNLTHVGGDVYIDKSALVSLSLSNLVTIEGALWLYLNGELVSADFRKLERAGVRVFIHRNIKLASLQIRALVEFGTADFSDVSDNSALADCFVTGTPLESVLSSSSLDCTCNAVCGLVEASC
jgi:hypothetical protein